MILRNIVAILLVIAILGVLGFALIKVLGWFFKLVDKTALKVSRKIKSKVCMTALEILYLINLLLFIAFFIIFIKYFIVVIFISITLMVFISGIIHGALLRFKGYYGIFDWLQDLKIFRCYFFKRVFKFSDIIGSFLFLLIAIILLSIVFSALEWPEYAYFGELLLIPVFSNIWIYFDSRRKFNEDKVKVTMKRCIIYITYLCFVIYNSYANYSANVMKVEIGDKFSALFLTTIFVIMISLDRILKEIYTDYFEYKKQKSQ